jgi:tRNA pseudouridine55 synthase
MPFDFLSGEILMVDKPYRWTSFDVVNKIRYVIKKELGIKKIRIGHAGTLDPLASGLLILCTGKFTRRIEEFMGYEKEYSGTFTFGASTPSFDLETSVDAEYPTDHLTLETIRAAAARFTGIFNQVPPMYSAKKIEGKRAYKFARNEQEVKLKPKSVEVSAFEILDWNTPDARFRVVCSKGTYIRALARDMGTALGTGAHLTALCRTRIGPWHLRDSYQVEDLTSEIARYAAETKIGYL